MDVESRRRCGPCNPRRRFRRVPADAAETWQMWQKPGADQGPISPGADAGQRSCRLKQLLGDLHRTAPHRMRSAPSCMLAASIPRRIPRCTLHGSAAAACATLQRVRVAALQVQPCTMHHARDATHDYDATRSGLLWQSGTATGACCAAADATCHVAAAACRVRPASIGLVRSGAPRRTAVAVPYSTLQYPTVPYSTLQYPTALYSTL